MRTSSNRGLVSHFFKHRATTRLEISTSTGIDDVSISQKLKILRSLGFIERKGTVGAPYRARTVRGAGVPLWGISKGLFLEAGPQDYVDAQKRYGEILLATRDPGTVRQSQIPEAVAFCKTYMDKRGLVTIPDSGLILPMLRVQGIRVDHSQLVKEMKKEGYTW